MTSCPLPVDVLLGRSARICHLRSDFAFCHLYLKCLNECSICLLRCICIIACRDYWDSPVKVGYPGYQVKPPKPNCWFPIKLKSQSLQISIMSKCSCEKSSTLLPACCRHCRLVCVVQCRRSSTRRNCVNAVILGSDHAQRREWR